jgi:predicted ferric reductase
MALLSCLVLAYVAIVLLPLWLAVGFGPVSAGNVVYEFGRSLALTAFPIVALQPLLGARISWIDRLAGKGNSLRFHKAMGISAFVALLLHPVCLAGGGAGWRLMTSWDFPWFIVVGKAALILLAAHVVLALFRSAIGFGFKSWRHVHLATAPLILIGGFVHSWYAGDDLRSSELQAYWIAVIVLAAAMWFNRRLGLTV